MTPADAPSLTGANWADWPVGPGWRAEVDAFATSDEGQQVTSALQQRLAAGAVVYPVAPLRALQLTDLDNVRVVILGQDPYHGPGQAEGLAFSVPAGHKPPPSLRNIHTELQRDLGARPGTVSLLPWAEQGVLLLNTCLTVERGSPGSHAKIGWSVLTDRLVRACSEHARPKVFMLWGAHAQSKQALIDARRHLVLCANHPSPLSARRPPQPFLGCGHFSQANRWLREKNQKEMHWV